MSKVNPIYVDFSVAEADYIRLAPRISADVQGRSDRPRQPLELLLSDDKPLPQKGRVVFVDRAMDNKTGTIGIRAEFPNPDQLIRPGQFGRVRGVIDQRPNAILVPQLAVQEQQGAKTVLVVEAGDKVGAPADQDRRPHRRVLHRHERAQAGRAGHRGGGPEGTARHAGETRAK